MKKILVPTDFSKGAKVASDYAAMLSRHIPAQIHFIHIYAIPLVSEYSLPADVERFIDQNRIDASDELAAFEAQFLKEHPLLVGKVSAHLEYGFIADKILEKADFIKADMIVMGTSGAGNMFDKLLGTNALKVLNRAKVPVWVIPKLAEINYPNWALYAADFLADEVGAIKNMLKLLKPLNVGYKVLHVHDKIALNIGHQIEAMASFLEDTFEADNVEVKSIHRNTVIEGIETYIKNQKPDILVLSKHAKSLLDALVEVSVTKHFAFSSRIPLLYINKA
jgi:nucleotide-binding universal stress UspA family protein